MVSAAHASSTPTNARGSTSYCTPTPETKQLPKRTLNPSMPHTKKNSTVDESNDQENKSTTWLAAKEGA